MIQHSDAKVWISVEQRLDGLTSQWGADPYITVTVAQGDDVDVEFHVGVALAKKIARGLNKAAKRAAA